MAEGDGPGVYRDGGYELSSSARFGVADLEALADSDDPATAYFGEASTPYLQSWSESFGDTKPIWDAAVVWHVLEPDTYECAEMGFDLGTGPAADFADEGIYDHLSPDYTDTRQVTGCTAFVDDEALAAFQAAVYESVGATAPSS